MLSRAPRPMPKSRRNEPVFLSPIVGKPARDCGEEVVTTAAADTAAV